MQYFAGFGSHHDDVSIEDGNLTAVNLVRLIFTNKKRRLRQRREKEKGGEKGKIFYGRLIITKK
jgi:hypothetical protein